MEGEAVGLDGSGARWRVFVSHTSELRNFPPGTSYVAAVERAISACGYVIVDMADFPEADHAPAEVCSQRVRDCDVYVGVLGTRYGSPVRDRPEVSYTELEFEIATEAGLDRLVFVLDEDAADVGIPLSRLIDVEFGARQVAFRRRILDSGLVTGSFTSPAGLGQLVERSLRELADQRRAPGPGPRDRVRRVWNIPARNPGFTGRDELLAAVRERLLAGDRTGVQAFQGMGGVGKTQLAIEYAHRFAGSYDVAWWVAAEQAGLIVGDQFAALGLALGCVQPGASMEAVRAAVLGELRQRDRWLLVFDNADSPADIAGWLPGGSGHVLITSRERGWSGIATPIEVDVLARVESIAILQNWVAGLSAADADQLAHALDDLPLALAQAAGFMAETGMPAAQYLGLLRTRAGQLLAQGEAGSYPHSLAAAIGLIAERLAARDVAAAELASLCAFLAPEPVPEDLFTGTAAELPEELAARVADPLAWRQTLAHLARQSLARVDQRGLLMNRLTQAILRDRLPSEMAAATRRRTEAILAASDPGDPGNPATWPRWAQLMPHLLAADLASTDNPGLRWTACNACWYLLSRGDARTGHDLASDLRRRWHDRLGSDDQNTLAITHYLAWALRDMGRFAEARDLDEDTLARRHRILGEDHPSTLSSASELAADLRELGEVQAARDLDEDTLARRRRVLGEDHPDTLNSATSLAADLSELGEVQAARDLDEDTLARRRRILGEDHPSTLTSAHNLAIDLYELGEVQAARDLDEDTLARRRRILGEDHPDTLNSATSLAANLSALGEVEAARELSQSTVDRRRRVQGEGSIGIAGYYFRTRGGARPLNEAKLLLLGWGGVGKTSLVNRLVYQRFNPSELRTEGIKVTSWPVMLSNDERVRLNVWDFGGQEIMHATHQFFLTTRSLYLVVLSGRAGTADKDADYWLQIVSSFAPESPVVVVLNQIAKDPFDLDEVGLRQKFPKIRAFVRTDCAVGDSGLGIDELLGAIADATDKLSDLRVNFPAEWFEIKDRLAAMSESYITFERYREICACLGEAEDQAQEQLADHLHSLGIALNYREDPRLRDTHVLNPHWVTEGIYAILNSRLVAEQKGEVALSDLSHILDHNRYPPERHAFLLDLMRRFELCFPYDDGPDQYLVADLLPKQQPDEAVAFPVEGSLRFEYHYPVFPEGLLPRFIVRSHVHSTDQPRWRNGALLRWEQNYALVQADIADQLVKIFVTGPQGGRRRLLAVIRSDFEHINSSYSFKVSPFVPVAGPPALAIEYDKLVTAERQGIKSFPEFVANRFVNIDVKAVLEGVDLIVPNRMPGAGSDAIDGPRPAKIFVSYSHRDEPHRETLESHLKVLKRAGLLDVWHDRRIDPGDEWKGKIDHALAEADVVVLLVSADFLASDYCYDVELSQALERNASGSCRIVPVIVRDAKWKLSRLSNLQALPADGKPITTWPDVDTAWRTVADGLERVIETLPRLSA